ncbi:S-layer homology domain-containing protein [Bacillus thuringiensis]|uniref:S-layer homology domain-containing protein n=1 Tax=Bacillus thuringiensis TaxID=1428 RepID=UPI0022259D99|nr:S-layer homology domain-containing protein [Bacillus thuringiensis]UYX53406.1 S-layer homology domain-containing protein [Bacillus thuringiensis]
MAKNKSFNKLMAGTMTAAMVAGVVAPVAASAQENTFKDVPSGEWYSKAINEMAAKGIISGKGEGIFGLGQDVTRAEVATFMVKAKGIEAGSTKTPFTDVNADDWFAKYVAAAEANKIMAGLGEGKFGPNEKLTRAQMAQLLVNAYGFKADENNKATFSDIDGLSWATAKSSIETLASLGLVSGEGEGKFNPNGVVTREAAAQFIYNAMNYKQPEAKVVSATPINAKQVEVKFGTEVNIDTKDAAKKAEALKLFTLEGKNATDITVSSDNKTVVLTFDKVHGVEDAVLVVNPVATKADAKVKTGKYTQVITYKDAARPEVTGVEYVDVNTAKVLFSEPIENIGEVTATKGAVKGDFKKGDNFVTINLSAVEENAEAVVTIVGATDFAGNLVSPNPVKVNVKKQAIDKTAPQVTGVEAVSNNKLKVTFSKEFTTEALATGITVNDEAPKSVELDKDNKKVAYVTVNEKLKDGVNTIKVAKDTKDSVGAKLEKEYVKQLVVTITEDKTAPELVKSEVVTDNGKQFLVLTYNEELEVASSLPGTGTLYKDYVTVDGKTFAGKVVTEERKDKKVVKVDLSGVEAGKWTINLGEGFVKDTSDNKNASKAKSVTFDVGTVKEEVKELTYTVAAEKNEVTVTFAGQVDGASATNAANYAIEGAKVEKAVLTSNGTAGATVKLTVKADSVEATGNYAVSVNGVKDNTKSVVAKPAEGANLVVNLTENVAPKVEKAELTNGKDLELTFSEAVKDVNAADFIVLLDGKDVTKELGTDKNITVTKVEGTEGSKATFTFSRPLDSKELAKTLTVKPGKDGVKVTDNNGNKLAAFESITVKNIIK